MTISEVKSCNRIISIATINMNLKEIHRTLREMFQQELTNERKRHVIFWYDSEGEFVDDIDAINLDEVRVWKMTKSNLFATKYELEIRDLTSNFLIYSNMSKPSPREDWMYSVYKLGDEFATDKTTVNMRELGIMDDSLRFTFKDYQQFFNNRIRFQSFKKFPVDTYTEEVVDLTVLAVLTNSRTNSLDEIVKSLMHGELEKTNKSWKQIQKFGNEEKLWNLMEKYYGYSLAEKSLKALAIFCMITYISQHIPEYKLPVKWKKYVSSRPANVIVFMDQWMNHREDREIYNKLADQVAVTLKLDEYINEEGFSFEEISHMDGFRLFDEVVIHYLVEQLTNHLTDFDTYVHLIHQRRKRHWFPEYKHEYEAINYAIDLIRLVDEIDRFIPEQTAEKMFQSYIEKYYLIDTAYRKFYVEYDQIIANDRLHKLREIIENLYSNWYIDELAMKWVGNLQRDVNSLWVVNGLTQQKEFYHNWVHPYQEKDERVFIIISDSLRYEVAKELMDELNKERKASTNISAMQGVLPSYTALGMASLLPHENIKYSNKKDILIDGISSKGIINREKILQKSAHDAMAILFNDVVSMNREKFRETFSGKKLIYIYHNSIDAWGDNQATEENVFQAAEKAIKEIRTLVNQLVHNVSASNIIITADHGFIYQRDKLTSSQKIPKYTKNVLLANRRFYLTNQPIDIEGTLSYQLDYIVDQETDLFVTVPKGVNRFAIQGAGANYVHGGAMLQEIVIPVITFKNDRSRTSRNEIRKVDVKLTTPIRKITNTVTYLEFFQTAHVEDKILPRILKVYFVDENGRHLSNTHKIIADHKSAAAPQRVFREKFVFKDKFYDKRKTYYLVLEDEDERSNPIYERYAFSIDI